MWKISCCFVLLLLFAQSCAIKDARISKNQFLNLYTDEISHEDSLLFKKFRKEEKIKVNVFKINPDTLLGFLERKKFNAQVDLIILSNFDQMIKLVKKKNCLQLKSTYLNDNIDAIYRSKRNTWFALSKTPLVFAYNSKILKKDTISNYYDLIHPKWNGKIAFQGKNHPTQICFQRNIRLMLKDKADTFLYKFYKQGNTEMFSNEFELLDDISQNLHQLSLIKLASIAQFQEQKSEQKSVQNLKVIFPNQRKRGCYMNVTSAAVYRYANNPLQAQKLIEFLSSKRAQFKFSKGRYEFPVLKGIEADYVLIKYGKFRGRFYKFKKKPKFK